MKVSEKLIFRVLSLATLEKRTSLKYIVSPLDVVLLMPYVAYPHFLTVRELL